MPKASTVSELSRRERMVMDIVYRLAPASVADVQAALPDQPSYSATRMLLQRLQKKGLLNYRADGPKYLYLPATAKQSAGKAAWTRLVKTFFAGSAATAFSALLGATAETLTDEELVELEQALKDAKAKRR